MSNITNKKKVHQRIAKLIAHSGAYSRRDAEKLINEGKVEVDGKILTSPATLVDGSEKIIIDGKKINTNFQTKIWLLNKPKGFISTSKDPQGRKTIFDLLPKNINHIMPIGRLDINTEGLLLFTNDGNLSRYMEHPDNKLIRKYKIKVRGKVAEDLITNMQKNITISRIQYNIVAANIISHSQSNTWLSIEISEGKNREIRNICEHFRLQINRLVRTNYGPFELNNIQKGEFIELPKKIIISRLKKIGYMG
jgi:23S rRNA pseudouridine2605 synthase